MREEVSALPFLEMSASPECLEQGESLKIGDSAVRVQNRLGVRSYACVLICLVLMATLATLIWRSGMNSVFGVVDVDTAAYEMLKQEYGYQIRRYAASTAIATSSADGHRGEFMRLAGFIGVIGPPQNTKGQKIAMTAPVVTFKNTRGEEMQFILPKSINGTAPQPTRQGVRVVQRPVAVYGVETFSGSWNDREAEGRARSLAQKLQVHGHVVKKGMPFQYMRYNPPWTLPMFRTNEVAVQIVEDDQPENHS